jgi:hypothetical protein
MGFKMRKFLIDGREARVWLIKCCGGFVDALESGQSLV